MPKSLSETEYQAVYNRYLTQLRTYNLKGKSQGETGRGLEVTLAHLWEYRTVEAKRTKSALEAMIRRTFPKLKDPKEFSKRRARELEKLLDDWTEELRKGSPTESVAGMKLYRSKRHEPLELRFALYEPIDTESVSEIATNDFDAFWLPYRKPQVETKIIVGEPAFVSSGKSHSRRFEPSVEQSNLEKSPKLIVFPYVRSWDFVSALKLQDLLLGVGRRSMLVAPLRVSIESSRQYEPLDDLKLMNLRSHNIIALGYPRDNAVLKSYQKRKGLCFHVLPDNDHSSGSQARPRVEEAGGETQFDRLTGEPYLKFCVLTRRLHTNQRNVVTVVAGNSSRAIGEVIDGLTSREVANSYLKSVRRSLHLNDQEPLPNEFQAVFVVEFTQDRNNEVRVAQCAHVSTERRAAHRAP